LTPQKQQFASAASYSWGEVMGYSWNSGDKLCLKSWRLLRVAHFKSWKLQHTLSLLCVQCRHLRHVITCRAKAKATLDLSVPSSSCLQPPVRRLLAKWLLSANTNCFTDAFNQVWLQSIQNLAINRRWNTEDLGSTNAHRYVRHYLSPGCAEFNRTGRTFLPIPHSQKKYGIH
jgi:hypothetical protein